MRETTNNIDINKEEITTLKQLEQWMQIAFAERFEKMREHDFFYYIKLRADKRFNNRIYNILKESDLDNLSEQITKEEFECIESSRTDTNGSSTYIYEIIKWLNNIFEFKNRWPNIISFLDEVKYLYDKEQYKKDRPIEYMIDEIILKLQSNDTNYLHKIHTYGTPDADVKFTVDTDYFTLSDNERMNTLCNVLPPCYGTYNGRIVLDYNTYFVGISPSELVNRFNTLKIVKQGKKEIPVRGLDKDALTVDLYNYARICSQLLKIKIGHDKEHSPKYIFFNKIDNQTNDNEIVKRISHYYNDVIKGVDLRTNTPLAESYFILVGWLFAPVESEQRLVGCFECKTSGIGKTAFIQALCNKTEVVFGSMEQPVGKANIFSFSPCFAQGPDIVNVDDPCSGTSDILQYVSNVVSNKKALVELKGGNRYTINDLETKIYISTNVPLYMKNDNNNFMSSKLFVLKANDTIEDKDLPDDERSSKIYDYIMGCEKEIVEGFISYCVDQYKKNGAEFIRSHMGIYIDKESESNLFNDILDYNLVYKAINNKTTLIECIQEDMIRHERDNEHNDIVLKCWNMVCKHIQTQYAEIAKETVASVPRTNGIYPVGSRPSKTRYKNFVITQTLKDKLLQCLSPNNSSAQNYDSVTFDSDEMF